MKNSKSLTIGWLYPKLMSIYGDRGNIIVLQKRCEWRNIEAEIKYLDSPLSVSELEKCDLLMMGGAQDCQQKIVSMDLKKKSSTLKKLIESGIPGLYVCGAYQFLGKFYKEADGTTIKGLGIFDLYTENPGADRLIGNLITEPLAISHQPLVGFENHGGRTFLGPNVKPMAKVIKGFGNNGQDVTEGAIYKNSIGTYMHGPILPKNPELADWLISKALEIKYGKKVSLEVLDESLENMAKSALAKKLNINL